MSNIHGPDTAILERDWRCEAPSTVTLNPAFVAAGRLQAGQPLFVKLSPYQRGMIGVVDPRHPELYRGLVKGR